MARVRTIEAAATVATTPMHAWHALLDDGRWAGWDAGGIRIDEAAPLDGALEKVGDRRQCAATIGVPLVGRRRVEWQEQVTDVDAHRTIEIEALPGSSGIRRWRVRFWLVPQAGGETRVSCRVSYWPATFAGRLIDRLVLRKRVSAAVEAWMDALSQSFMPSEAPVVTLPGTALNTASGAAPGGSLLTASRAERALAGTDAMAA